VDSRDDNNTTVQMKEEQHHQEDDSSCTMSLGDFSMTSLGECLCIYSQCCIVRFVDLHYVYEVLLLIINTPLVPSLTLYI